MKAFPIAEAINLSNINYPIVVERTRIKMEQIKLDRLNNINEEIKKSALNGEYAYCYESRLDKETVDLFVKEGYVLVHRVNGPWSWTNIYWGVDADKVRCKWWYKIGWYWRR
jgi:hypothetical protein